LYGLSNTAESRRPVVLIVLVMLAAVFFFFSPISVANGQDTGGDEKKGPVEVPKSPEEEALQKQAEEDKQDADCYDKVVLKDGAEIKGRIVDPGGPTIRVEQKLGAISILKSQIKELKLNEKRMSDSADEDVIHLKTGEELRGKVTSSEDGKELVIEVTKEGQEHKVKLPRGDVLKIEWAKDKKERLEKQIESIEDPFTSVVNEMIDVLSSEDPAARRDAGEKLKGLGIFALDYMKERLPSLDEPGASRIREILRIAEIKSFVSPETAKALKKNVYEELVSSGTEEKQILLRQIILLEDDGASQLLMHIAKQKEEEVEVRNFCLHSLASADRNYELLKLMSEAEKNDGWLRLASALHLADNGIYAGAPHLISALRMRDPGMRWVAVEKLRKASGRNFGFDPKGTEAEREQAVKKWETWWEENSAEVLRHSAKQMSSKPISDDDKGFSELYQKRGHNSWDKGKREEARENFRKALELDPSNLSARLALAILLYSEFKENKEARREIRLVLKRYGKEASPVIQKLGYYHTALLDLSDGDWASALHNLQVAIGLDGNFTDGYIALGRTYYLQAVNDKTISRETIMRLPETERQEIKRRRKDVIERSVRALEIGLSHIDDDIRDYTNMDFRKKRREVERELGERPGARPGGSSKGDSEIAFKEALLDKKAKTCASLAESYAMQLEWRKAARCLSDAAQLAPDEPQYFCKLGNALAAAGKREEAREAFKRCLKLDPKNKTAKEGLEDLK